MKKCICGKYQLTYGDMFALSPSKGRVAPSINCPECNEKLGATRKSQNLFLVILVISFIVLGFLSAAWIPANSSYLFIVIMLIGFVVNYFIVWPLFIELEFIKASE